MEKIELWKSEIRLRRNTQESNTANTSTRLLGLPADGHESIKEKKSNEGTTSSIVNNQPSIEKHVKVY